MNILSSNLKSERLSRSGDVNAMSVRFEARKLARSFSSDKTFSCFKIHISFNFHNLIFEAFRLTPFEVVSFSHGR